MANSKEEKINNIITKTMADKEVTNWSEIVEAVSKEMNISNWMVVRGVLQFQIDKREIERTPDLHKELYIKLCVD